MTLSMAERGAMGGRPHRKSWAEIEAGNQLPGKAVKNKVRKRRNQVKNGVTSKEAILIRGLINLEYGI